jgi:hypothetical protein
MTDPRTSPLRDPRIPYAKDPQEPGPAAPEGYSATALASHWFEHPEPVRPEPVHSEPVHSEPVHSEPVHSEPVHSEPVHSEPVVPDRVEGEILRFGPGVTAAVHARFRDQTAASVRAEPQAVPEEPRGGLRQYTLAAVVLVLVLAFLAWQRFGPDFAVRDVSAHTTAGTLGCGATADVVGVVRTNGRAGTVTYHWVRSDGTVSRTLHEKVTKGQHVARLHLMWTIRGRGEFQARAELRVSSPSVHVAAARFTYRCA